MRRLNSNIQDIVPNVRLGLNLKVSLWRLKTVKSRAAGNLENRCNPIATEIKVGKTAACHTGGEEMQSQHNAIDSLGSVWRQRQRVLTWFWISWKQNNWAKQSLSMGLWVLPIAGAPVLLTPGLLSTESEPYVGSGLPVRLTGKESEREDHCLLCREVHQIDRLWKNLSSF